MNTVLLSMKGDADPTLLPRVCSVLCTVGIVPLRLSSTSQIDGTMDLLIEVADAPSRSLDLVERKLAQMPQTLFVESVADSTDRLVANA